MLGRNDLYKLMRAVAGTRETEIGCDECFDQMDRFAEIAVSRVPTAMPLVCDHLRICVDCHETYEALLIAIGRP